MQVDQRTLDEPDKWVQSACVLCSNGCGCDIGVKDGRIVGVRGRAEEVVNHGRLGPKGLHGWEANNSADCLTHPLVRRNGTLKRASWDEAMQLIVEKTRQVKRYYTARDRLLHKRPVLPQGYDGLTEVERSRLHSAYTNNFRGDERKKGYTPKHVTP